MGEWGSMSISVSLFHINKHHVPQELFLCVDNWSTYASMWMDTFRGNKTSVSFKFTPMVWLACQPEESPQPTRVPIIIPWAKVTEGSPQSLFLCWHRMWNCKVCYNIESTVMNIIIALWALSTRNIIHYSTYKMQTIQAGEGGTSFKICLFCGRSSVSKA